jgi:hypothetical protein
MQDWLMNKNKKGSHIPFAPPLLNVVLSEFKSFRVDELSCLSAHHERTHARL